MNDIRRSWGPHTTSLSFLQQIFTSSEPFPPAFKKQKLQESKTPRDIPPYFREGPEE
jgi:hypothetical protein